ncbi:MAG: helix-hairpin-helix domain-containing protein, partial [Bacteroidota bacterium]
ATPPAQPASEPAATPPAQPASEPAATPAAAAAPSSTAASDAASSEEATTPNEASSEAVSLNDDYTAAPPTSDEADNEAVATDATETTSEDTEDAQEADEAQAASGTEPDPEPDDFSVLQGVGPKIADRLHEAGFITFADLADATPSEIRDRIDELPPFVNVIAWVEQAGERAQ